MRRPRQAHRHEFSTSTAQLQDDTARQRSAAGALTFGMARVLPRISFNSSTFVRLLSELAEADVEVSRQPFAERLGLWLDWTAAIPLAAALHASAPAPAIASDAAWAPPKPCAAGAAAADAMARVRAEVAQAITTDTVLTARATASASDNRQAMPAAGVATDLGSNFLPYRRCYQAHQRLMQARIAALRAQVREALAGRSAALGTLAALDGVLDQALAARERSLLATVPSLLEARFARLQRAHLAAQARLPGFDSAAPGPAQPAQPDAWLALACKDMQNVLMAEMDIRLQPVVGLVDALCNGLATQT